METTFECNAIRWSVITEPWAKAVGYLSIIVAEGMFAALLAMDADVTSSAGADSALRTLHLRAQSGLFDPSGIAS